MGLLTKPRYAYHLLRNTVLLRDWRYGRTTADLGIPPTGLSVNPRGLRFEELNITIPRERDALLPNFRDAAALSREAGVNFRDSEDGIIAITPGFKAHVNWGEELFILREILCAEVYNFGTAAKNVVVWDIGMNAGLASLYFASRPNVRAVIGFEPFRPTFDAAVRNVQLNPSLQPKIKMHNFGIAARSYATDAEYNSRWKGGISVSGVAADRREELEILQETFTVEHIELQPADEVLRTILADYPEHAVVAKIDCEGSEYEIFRCLSDHRLLQEISIIMLEWHIRGPRELLDMLHASGFSTYSFPLGPVTGMLYAFKQGGTAGEGHRGASLSYSDKGESEPFGA